MARGFCFFLFVIYVLPYILAYCKLFSILFKFILFISIILFNQSFFILCIIKKALKNKIIIEIKGNQLLVSSIYSVRLGYKE